MNEEKNLAVLNRAIENFNNRENREKYFELYDDKIVLRGYTGVEPGLPNVKQFYQALWQAFPDSFLTVEDMIAREDKVVCRFTMSATHQGIFMNIEATSKR
jgi:predicted ester cyclase